MIFPPALSQWFTILDLLADHEQKARREILNSKSRPAKEAKNRADTTVFDHLVHSERTDTPYGVESCSRVAQVGQFIPNI